MSRREATECPLCGADPERVYPWPDRDVVSVYCRRCAEVRVTGTLLITQRITAEIAPYLSAYTRECADTGREPDFLHTDNVETIAQRFSGTPVAEKLDKLLQLAAGRSGFPGAPVPFSPDLDYPVLHSRNREEAAFHLARLAADGFIEALAEDRVVVTHRGWQRLEQLSRRPRSRPSEPEIANAAAGAWDAFICHAGEDKEDVVEPLAEALRGRGLTVWYDRWVLTIGDSLRRRIDEGLAKSRYGVVVLSPAFFGKGWPERELDGLVQREVEGRKVILPVWHRVSRDDIARYSLPLADKVAGSTAQGIEKLAEEIVRVVQEETGLSSTGLAGRAPPDEKWVDINYPRDSGLQGQLEAAGYRVRWCFDSSLSRALDLEGWEYAYQNLGGGRRTVLKLRDRPDNQTLIVKRQA